MTTITVQTTIQAPIAKVWECWNTPKHITGWAFASDQWEAPTAENNLCIGGTFNIRMQAKDGSSGFDFVGTYTAIKEHEFIAYDFGNRHARITFKETPEGVQVTETFDPEEEHPIEMQKNGWQAILNNFKKYVETYNSKNL